MRFSCCHHKVYKQFLGCKNTEKQCFSAIKQMNKKNENMNTKRILVSFLLIASVLFLASTISAAPLAQSGTVKVDDVTVVSNIATSALTNADVGITSGDTITIDVQFTAVNDFGTECEEISTCDLNSTSDVKIKAELEGQDVDVIAISDRFDVIAGRTYVKTMTIKVPSDLKEDLADKTFSLTLRIYNSEFETEVEDIPLTLQRPSYDIAIKSISTSNSIDAGELIPVEVVLKNVGFNDLSDLYVTVRISELNIQKSGYFGDLVSLEEDCDDCDNDDTVSGTLYLEVPYTVKAGTYTLEVKAENEDTESVASKSVVINNAVSEIAMKSGNDLTLLNPTNQLRVYKLVYQDKEVSVVVPAASSKTVTIETPTEGEYKFDVMVFSGDQLLSTVNFAGTSQTTVPITSPVMVLTVILAVVFLVLLVVLVVLITKKPQKAEEFGESYY